MARKQTATLKPGLIFEHKHWLDSSTNAPLKCKVTRITRDRVYYRGYYGLHDDGSEWLGGGMWLGRAKFEVTYVA